VKKIHLILSPLDNSQLTFINGQEQLSDLVVCLDNIELDDALRNRCKFISEYNIDSKVKSKEFYSEVLNLKSTKMKNIILAYSDIFCVHLLDKLFKVLLFIESQSSCDSLYIYAAKDYGNTVPISGYKTIELRRGSDLLLGAFVAKKLQSVYPHKNFIFKYRKPDIFCISILRRFIIKSLDFVFLFNLIFKVFILRRKLQLKNKIKNNKALFIARVPHQIRYSKSIAMENKQEVFNLLVIPQARQGKISELLQSINELPPNVNVVLPSIKRLTLITVKVVFDSFKIKRIKAKQVNEVITVKFKDGNILFNAEELCSEPLCLLTDFLYKEFLHQYFYINRSLINRVVSFSLKGRYAKFEKQACENVDRPMYTVQTAALDDFPSAVFPLADIFFADSLTSLKSISSNGCVSGGVIEYSGCPYRIKPIKIIDQSKSITYFTQPYEYKETLVILFSLLNWCKNKGFILNIKLHPRDKQKNYKKLMDVFPHHLLFACSSHSELAIKTSDLCIARTSSIISEALAEGVPVIVCLLSSFDKTLKISFLDLVKNEGFFIENESQLLHLLDRPDILIDKSQALQRGLYSDKDIKGLSHRILSV
jgi:hypothetical protein